METGRRQSRTYRTRRIERLELVAVAQTPAKGVETFEGDLCAM